MTNLNLGGIKNKIYVIRNKKVMLDSDLAQLYGVETRTLNQAIKRNIKRFPEKFMFQITKNEFDSLRSQFVTSNQGGRRYLLYVFTEALQNNNSTFRISALLKAQNCPKAPYFKPKSTISCTFGNENENSFSKCRIAGFVGCV